MGNAASEKELTELSELLAQHNDLHYFIEMLSSLKGVGKHYESATEEENLIQENWSMLQLEIKESLTGTTRGNQDDRENGLYKTRNAPIIRKYARRVIGYAAVFSGILLLACGALFFWKKSFPKDAALTAKINQVVVPSGAPIKKILPDSSVVWLNAGSQIRYADQFIGNKREVYINGEAYFKIKQDEKHPFIVHAGNITIRVLGTEFNVQAYGDEDRIETTLISGKVQVQITGKPDKKIILTPHEKLTVINQEFKLSGKASELRKELSFQVKEVVPLKTTTPIQEVAWLDDKLAFQNERFSELAKRLERRYDVHIVFVDTLLNQERLSGVFENESIGKALKILQMTTPFHYQTHGDTVYLKQ